MQSSHGSFGFRPKVGKYTIVPWILWGMKAGEIEEPKSQFAKNRLRFVEGEQG